MIVCLATFNNRLAAVFETADTYALYQWQRDACRILGTVPVGALPAPDKATMLAHHCVSMLICGAICGCDMRALRKSGIEVVPWICGTVDEVLAALCSQELDTLKMPGCRWQTGDPSGSAVSIVPPLHAGQHRFRRGCPKISDKAPAAPQDTHVDRGENHFTGPGSVETGSASATPSVPSPTIKQTAKELP